MVVELPSDMVVAARLSVGAAGGAPTAKVALVAADVPPPALVQVNVNVSVPALAAVIVLLPLAARVPVQLPDAVQLMAFKEDQVIVVEAPVAIEGAPSVSEGAPGGISASAASA